MFKLTIDGKTAVIKTGTSIKLTRENPLVTESGDYTFDVQLPLRGCPENIEIFGALYRPEVSISAVAGKRLPFTLITDVFSISGKAVVTSVTQDEAKVQLLAGRSALNESTKDDNGDDIYIDELELGRYFDNRYKYIYDIIAERHGEKWDLEDDEYIEPSICTLLQQAMEDAKSDIVIHDDANSQPFVSFPIYETYYVCKANQHKILYCNRGTDDEYYLYCFLNLGLWNKLAVQPYLVAVLERVLKAIGYTVGTNQIRESWMRNIFIASAKHCVRVNRILPHWTVDEFLKEIENFFGCVINIEDKTASITMINDELENIQNFELHYVVDETLCDIEIEDEERIQNVIYGNIEYTEIYESNVLRLPDEIWKKAIVKTFSDKNEMETWISTNLDQTEIEKSKYLFCVEDEQKVYAHLEIENGQSSHWQLLQVDVNPALIRNGQFNQKERNIDVTLNISPVIMKRHNFFMSEKPENRWDHVLVDIPFSEESSDVTYDDEYSVNDAINDSQEDDDAKNDWIPIAWNTMLKQQAVSDVERFNFNIPFAVGIPYLEHEIDSNFFTHIPDPQGIDNLCLSSRDFANTRFSQNLKTNVVRQFSFTDNINPNPNAIYLIRGKRYLCQKIELTIDEKGVNPLKKGYFYELN